MTKLENPMQTKVDVFSSRDLRSKAGTLIKEAQAGHLSIITTHGRPAAITLPFNGRLMEQGAHHHLAATLFEQKQVTLVQAAKIADLSVEEFLEVLKVSNIDAVDYSATELEEEASVFA
jgi:prevent-host-death family protein